MSLAAGQSVTLESADCAKEKQPVWITLRNRPALDTVNYEPRTWRKDLSLILVKSIREKIETCYKTLVKVGGAKSGRQPKLTMECTGRCTPSIFWLLLLDDSLQGLYILMASILSAVLLPPPHLFALRKRSHEMCCIDQSAHVDTLPTRKFGGGHDERSDVASQTGLLECCTERTC